MIKAYFTTTRAAHTCIQTSSQSYIHNTLHMVSKIYVKVELNSSNRKIQLKWGSIH